MEEKNVTTTITTLINFTKLTSSRVITFGMATTHLDELLLTSPIDDILCFLGLRVEHLEHLKTEGSAMM